MLQSAIPSHPLNFAGLSSFCEDHNSIGEEYAGIPQVTAKMDELPAGAEVKNRYANVVPLPETRVTLSRLNNDPLTEYINASYVRVSSHASAISCKNKNQKVFAQISLQMSYDNVGFSRLR